MNCSRSSFVFNLFHANRSSSVRITSTSLSQSLYGRFSSFLTCRGFSSGEGFVFWELPTPGTSTRVSNRTAKRRALKRVISVDSFQKRDASTSTGRRMKGRSSKQEQERKGPAP